MYIVYITYSIYSIDSIYSILYSIYSMMPTCLSFKKFILMGERLLLIILGEYVFFRLLEVLISGSCIEECWEKV